MPKLGLLLKGIAVSVGIALLLVLPITIPYLNKGGEVVEVRGVVVAPFASSSHESDSYYMRVELESGKEVLVPVSRTIPVLPGKPVVLTTRQGTELGVAGYQFARYSTSGT